MARSVPIARLAYLSHRKTPADCLWKTAYADGFLVSPLERWSAFSSLAHLALSAAGESFRVCSAKKGEPAADSFCEFNGRTNQEY